MAILITNKAASSSSSSTLNVTSVTAATTLTTTNDVVLASGGAFTLTLPAASVGTKLLRIKKTDLALANIITIKAAGTDTINGGQLILLNTTGNTTAASTSVTSLASVTPAPVAGNLVRGPGITSGTTVASFSGTTIVLSAAASQTITGAPIYVVSNQGTTLNTQQEEVELISDGVSSWYVSNRRIDATPLRNVFTITPTNFGTTTFPDIQYARKGSYLQISGTFTTGTLTGNPALITMPTGVSVDFNQVGWPIISGDGFYRVPLEGNAWSMQPTGAPDFYANDIQSIPMADFTSPTMVGFSYGITASGAYRQTLANALASSNAVFNFLITLPVVGWNG